MLGDTKCYKIVCASLFVYRLPSCPLAPRLRRRAPVPRPGGRPCSLSGCLWRLFSCERTDPLFFPFSISGRSLNDKTYDAPDALDDVPPLHHTLFGYCFALCSGGASAGTRRGLDTRNLGMYRREKPSTPLNLNELGDYTLICLGVSCIEQWRAC